MACEKNFENKVKEHLKAYGAWFIKYWGGGGFTKSGIPDIIACYAGSFFGIEVKADKGEPTLLQLYNLEKIRKAGGYGILLYPRHYECFKGFFSRHSVNDEWYRDNIAEQLQWKKKLEGEE